MYRKQRRKRYTVSAIKMWLVIHVFMAEDRTDMMNLFYLMILSTKFKKQKNKNKNMVGITSQDEFSFLFYFTIEFVGRRCIAP